MLPDTDRLGPPEGSTLFLSFILSHSFSHAHAGPAVSVRVRSTRVAFKPWRSSTQIGLGVFHSDWPHQLVFLWCWCGQMPNSPPPRTHPPNQRSRSCAVGRLGTIERRRTVTVFVKPLLESPFFGRGPGNRYIPLFFSSCTSKPYVMRYVGSLDVRCVRT